jgi:arginine/lysine/ornithine decarboxylase
MDDSILGHDGVAERDQLKLSVDVTGLGITGYQGKDWLQEQKRLTVQLGDARRIICSLAYSDDDYAIDRLGSALEDLAADPPAPDRPAPRIPDLTELDLEQAMDPRDAYFAETDEVSDPAGRISAEMVSPYPPACPPCCRGNGSTPRSSTTCGPPTPRAPSRRTPPTPSSRRSGWSGYRRDRRGRCGVCPKRATAPVRSWSRWRPTSPSPSRSWSRRS